MCIVPDLNPDAMGGVACALAALVHPPAYCPGCLAEAKRSWPDGATSRTCPRCLAHLRRVWQVHRWNADHAHQVLAGQTRAQQFTSEYQQAAAFACFAAFSARWRASQGLGPLSADAVRKYLTPELIRGPLGMPLRPELQQDIYRTWCAGELYHVTAWLCDDPPPEPNGLWASHSPITDPIR